MASWALNLVYLSCIDCCFNTTTTFVFDEQIKQIKSNILDIYIKYIFSISLNWESQKIMFDFLGIVTRKLFTVYWPKNKLSPSSWVPVNYLFIKLQFLLICFDLICSLIITIKHYTQIHLVALIMNLNLKNHTHTVNQWVL